MSRYIKYILSGVMAVMVVAMGAASLILEKKTYSENENRTLEEMPNFTVNKVISGEYVRELEGYLSDHFVLRDEFMSLYANTQKLQGMREVNGVYICSDGYLIEKNEKYQNLDKISSKFNAFYEKNKDKSVNMYVMLVPTSITYNKDLLPDNAKTVSQFEAINYIYGKMDNGVKKVETFDTDSDGAFDKRYKTYQMYYKTDHHWTTYGAYFAYENFCKTCGIAPNDMGSYVIRKVSDSFYGTVASKVNDKSIEPDEMVSFIKDRNIKVTYQKGVSDSLYNEEYLNKKDKYSYFLNNINDRITIENNEVKNGKVLLIAKDSYANCMVPFLVDHYEKVIVLDTRYYMYGLTNIIDKENVTDVLLLFNMNTIDTETAVNGIY